MEESSGEHLGALWEASVWESVGSQLEGLKLRRHLGDIWRSDLRNRNTSQLKCKSCINILFLSRVFEGRCHKVL